MTEEEKNTKIAEELAILHSKEINNYFSKLGEMVSMDTIIDAEGIFLINTMFHVSKDYGEYAMMVRRMILSLTTGIFISQMDYKEKKRIEHYYE